MPIASIAKRRSVSDANTLHVCRPGTTSLRTTLLVVLRLRSRVAQRLSARVFVRYIGGDPELARETLANQEVQEQLSQEQPDHPARAFGEARWA